MAFSCAAAYGLGQQKSLGRCSHTAQPRLRNPLTLRATPNAGKATDTSSGKIPDTVKVSTQPTTTPDSRQNAAPLPGSAPVPEKRKGAWTPPYPSLVNTKPLPSEDVKTNIDM